MSVNRVELCQFLKTDLYVRTPGREREGVVVMESPLGWAVEFRGPMREAEWRILKPDGSVYRDWNSGDVQDLDHALP